MKVQITSLSLFIASVTISCAASISFQNLNTAGDNGYGLFDSGGTRLPTALSANVRIGSFSVSNTDVTNFWNSGDVAGLDSAFDEFGSAGISIADGLFQDSASNTISSGSTFDGQNITFFISSADDFTSTSNEYLIFVSDTLFGNDDSGLFTASVNLGEVPGSLLVGSRDNSFDFGGGSSLLGFNTAAVVPEPSTFALIAGCFGLALAMVRRRV